MIFYQKKCIEFDVKDMDRCHKMHLKHVEKFESDKK